MDLTFTGRGLPVSHDVREQAAHKLARLERLEPRAMRIDLEFSAEHHPSPDGLKTIKAALKIPRKTFRARAEADDVRTALDHVAEKLERQIREYHSREVRPRPLSMRTSEIHADRDEAGEMKPTG
jgi:ribosomal subunit interface protein